MSISSTGKYVIGAVCILLVLLLAYYTLNVSTVTTPTPSQMVYANNGTVSGNTYCAGTGGLPWNNELPLSWKGAKCQSSSDTRWDCNTVPTTIDPNVKQAIFTCVPTGTGWH